MDLKTVLNIFHNRNDLFAINADIDDWTEENNVDYNLTIEDGQAHLNSYQVINGQTQTSSMEGQITYYSGSHKKFKSWAIKNGLNL